MIYIFFLFVFYICTIPLRKVYNQKYKHVLPNLRAIENLKVQKHPRPSNFTIVQNVSLYILAGRQ